MSHAEKSGRPFTVSPAIRICLIYAWFGALWILFSDAIVQAIFGQNHNTLTVVQTFKGWIFILITGTLLYYLLKREFDSRQESEAKALDRETHFRDLFESNPLPMWMYHETTLQFLEVNAAACAHYGYSREEFLHMDITDIRPPEEIERLKQDLAVQKTGYRVAGEWLHRIKDGRIISADITAHSLNYQGKPAVMVVARDITERKQAEEERLENEKLRVQLSKEAELHQMRNRFISMVSHEFRRPLTTITTSIELLENYRSKMTDEGAAKHFTRIHEQLDETNELLDDFLALMRTENSQQGLSSASVDVTDICQKLVDQLRLSNKGKHTLSYSSEYLRVQVKGDEKLLRHAVSNLLTNAVKYSPNGTEVRLDLRQADCIEIHVSDQGIGIPAKDQQRLFEPFFRATNVGEIKGTGLGLSIARQAIELHGGTLKIAKSDSSGTEFVITLPISEEVLLTEC